MIVHKPNEDTISEALRVSELKYRRLFESARDGILILDAETGIIVDVNPFLVELLGISRETFLDRKIWELGFFEDILANEDKFYELRTKEYVRYEDLPLRSSNGRSIAVEFVSNVYLVNHQRVIQCNIRDISARKRTEEALREALQRATWLAKFPEDNPAPVVCVAADGTILYCNLASASLSSWACEAGKFPPHPIQALVKSARAENALIKEDIQLGERFYSVSAVPSDQRSGAIVYGTDITELKVIEIELLEKERLLSESQRLGHIGSWLMRTTGPSAWSDEFYRLLGLSPNEFPATMELLYSVIHPDDRHLMHAWVDASTAGEKPEELDFRINLPDGTIRFIKGRGESVFNDKNELIHMAGSAQDITSYKKAEEEQRTLTAQLHQAQKMESVGRLAGGVAHDFNNLLGVILGYSEFALQGIDPEQALYENLMEIRKAALRSADLTRQLLAFARRQTALPKVLDLNQIITNMLKMLHRIIGEDIKMNWHPFKDLWQVKIDPSQIDQILANLCVNARDAINSCGELIIKTGNITLDEAYCAAHIGSVPGEYVIVTVCDNGCGMEEETLEQIFEPFFTTKDIGKGTGLGLSTVYGIIKQNNGYIHADSEIGHGTTFTIYLPRHRGKADQAARTGEMVQPLKRGHETILLVEDEPGMLKITRSMLEMQGYTVVAASMPGEAIRRAREHAGKIHLLMTDVVMPEMNGRDLAKNLLSLYPDIKCLFMSGYTADIIANHGVLIEGVHFVQKPFTLQSMTTKIREVLDEI